MAANGSAVRANRFAGPTKAFEVFAGFIVLSENEVR